MSTMAVRMSADVRREQLLDATKAIVGRAGFHAVSIEAVAREAGITRPVVYEHFDGLPGLLDALVQRETVRALHQLQAVLPSGQSGNPRRRLLDALRGYLTAVREDPVTWRLVLMPPEGAPELLRSRIRLGREQVVGSLAELGGSALGPGRESPDPELSGRTLSAIADECARLLITDPRRYPISRLTGHAEWLLDQLQLPAG
jgi:AcrR family transcriptional regulator